jgi:hypothetical protein
VGISSADVERLCGEVASPAVMKRDLEGLKLHVRTIWLAIFALIGGGLLLPKACERSIGFPTLSQPEPAPRSLVSPRSPDAELSEVPPSR